MTWSILDLECQNIEYKGHISSPFNPDNYIVAPAWAHDDGPVHYEYFNSKEEANSSDWLKSALAGQSVLVAHNATFEIHWLLHRHYDDFLDFLKRGGRIFCTQYAEYLLSNQTEQYPKLEDVSLKYGGTKKIDEVKLLWEQGYKTADIERNLLLQYLAGPSGDIENTRKVCFQQHALLMARGMLEGFWLRMDSLLFNAFCTFNGLYVDRAVAHKNHQEQLERAEALRAEVLRMMPKDLPTEFEFNFGSDYHMSAWLFGGPVRYDKRVPYDPPKYEKIDAYKIQGEDTYIEAKVADQFMAEGRPHNYEIYKSGKNKGTTKIYSIDSKVEKLKWGDGYYNFPGLINLVTLPAHVSEQFLGKRAEFRGKRFLADDTTPVYSTGKDALDLLAAFTDVAKPLKELAQLDKDNSTYYITYEYNKDGSVKKIKGMLQYVGDDCIIHHSLNGTSTVTTRLSSSNPNLQNLPRDGTSKVKEMFSSRFGELGKIVEVDYTALEVVALAAISGDDNLLQNLLNGTDMHCYRLAGKIGRPYEELVAIVADKNHPEHKSIKQQRTDIKPQAFAAQYGASAHGISFATGCSIEEAEAFLATEAKLFPQSFAYSRTVVREEVERTGSEPDGLFREMMDDGRWSVYRRGYFKAPGGTCYSFRQYPKWVGGQEVMDYKDTQIANYWAQGEASFIVQVSCGRVIRWLIENDFFGGCVLPVNTVHDALYLDCVNEEWARYSGKYVANLMETTPKYMCEIIPGYKDWRYHTTPWPAVPEFGRNMHEKEKC